MAEELGSVLMRVSTDDAQFRRGVARARGDAGRLESSFGRVSAAIITVNQAYQLFSRAGRAAFDLVLSPAIEFERQMNRVRALTQATGDDFARLEETAKELGSTTAFSASQASDAMGFLAQAGFNTEKIIGAMPGTLNLAAAAQLDLAQSADIVSNVMTGYGIEAEETGRAVDVLTKAFVTSNTDLAQLGQAMKFAGPVAKGMGIEFEESAAALGLMGNAGIQASMAGTSLRGALVRLSNPTAAIAEVMQRLGLNVKDSNGDLLSLEEILVGLEGSGATTAEVMEIFGQRAGPGMLALLDQGSGALAEFTQNLRDSGGTAEHVADVQLEGAHGAWVELTSAFEGFTLLVSDELGLMDSLTETLLEITDSIRSVTQAIKDMSSDFDANAVMMQAMDGDWKGFRKTVGDLTSDELSELDRALNNLMGNAAKGGFASLNADSMAILQAAMQEVSAQMRDVGEAATEAAGTGGGGDGGGGGTGINGAAAAVTAWGASIETTLPASVAFGDVLDVLGVQLRDRMHEMVSAQDAARQSAHTLVTTMQEFDSLATEIPFANDAMVASLGDLDEMNRLVNDSLADQADAHDAAADAVLHHVDSVESLSGAAQELADGIGGSGNFPMLDPEAAAASAAQAVTDALEELELTIAEQIAALTGPAAGLVQGAAAVGAGAAGQIAGVRGAMQGFEAGGPMGAAAGFFVDLLMKNPEMKEAFEAISEALVALVGPIAKVIAPMLMELVPLIEALAPAMQVIAAILRPTIAPLTAQIQFATSTIEQLNEFLDRNTDAITGLVDSAEGLQATMDDIVEVVSSLEKMLKKVRKAIKKISSGGGIFHDGGVVQHQDLMQLPGMAANEGLILAEAGETVTPAGAAPQHVTINLGDDDGMMSKRQVRTLVQQIQEAISDGAPGLTLRAV